MNKKRKTITIFLIMNVLVIAALTISIDSTVLTNTTNRANTTISIKNFKKEVDKDLKKSNKINATKYIKNNGSEQSKEIQKLLDCTMGKGTKDNPIIINFGPGTYKSNEKIRIFGNTIIQGAGTEGNNITKFTTDKRKPFFINGEDKYGRTLYPEYREKGYHFDRNGSGNITIKNILFANSRVISIGHGNNITIDNIKVVDVPNSHAIEINASSNIKILNSTFEGMDLKNAEEMHKNRDYNEVIQIDRNTEKAFPHFGFYNGDIVNGKKLYRSTKNVLIENCTFKKSKNNKIPVAIGSHTADDNISPENIKIKNCNISDTTKAGISFYHVNSFSVENTKIENAPIGIQYNLNANANTKNITIRDNTINNVNKGIRIVNNTKDKTILNLNIINNKIKGKNGEYGIYGYAENKVIKDNLVEGFTKKIVVK